MRWWREKIHYLGFHGTKLGSRNTCSRSGSGWPPGDDEASAFFLKVCGDGEYRLTRFQDCGSWFVETNADAANAFGSLLARASRMAR